MEVQHAAGGNNDATSEQLHHLMDLWASARAMVFRIEGFALVAILLSFFVVTFGSCRRWSNRWIIQKGFLAASALSVSLGTYSIGLMQSSSVKSRMYPVWSVSLLALFVSVDSISTYTVDYSGQLLKMMYQLCLYFGYALLITVSTAAPSDGAVDTAIGVLCAITLFKGIHRLMAYVFPSRLRSMSQEVAYGMMEKQGGSRDLEEGASARVGCSYMVFTAQSLDFLCETSGNGDGDVAAVVGMEIPAACSRLGKEPSITMGTVWGNDYLDELGADAHIYEDICLSFSLCHLLQRRLFGFHCAESGRQETLHFLFERLLRRHHQPAGPSQQQAEPGEEGYDHERAFKVIEAELAFLYDYMYSSDAYSYYYEYGFATAWTLASIVGICSLGLVVAMATSRAQQPSPPPDHQAAKAAAGAAAFVDTTTADLAITMAILVSLASLQVLQLVRCWSSNWARLSLACWLHMARKIGRRMRLKAAFLGKVKWLVDRYQWQNKLGQLSIVDDSSSSCFCTNLLPCFGPPLCCLCSMCPRDVGALCIMAYYCFMRMFGLRYIRQALQESLSCGPGGSIGLTHDVKKAIVDTLIRTRGKLTNGSSSLKSNGLPQDLIGWACAPPDPKEFHIVDILFPFRSCCEPQSSASQHPPEAAVANQAAVILTWHIATCLCDKSYAGENKEVPSPPQEEDEERRARIKRYHGVATSLSKYCAYLVAYVPELLPGQQSYTRAIYDDTVRRIGRVDLFYRGEKLKRRLLQELAKDDEVVQSKRNDQELVPSKKHDDELLWKVLADFWAEMLLYLAPSDNVTAHMERLAQGGEFITHLWALLFHAGIVMSPPSAPPPPPAATPAPPPPADEVFHPVVAVAPAVLPPPRHRKPSR